MSVLKRVFPTTLVATGILLGSLVPNPGLPDPGVLYFDKIVHAGAYTLLGLSLYFCIPVFGRKKTRVFIAAFLFCLAFGGIIELLQGFTGRTPDLLDFFANGAGSIAGIGAAFLTLSIKKKSGGIIPQEDRNR